MKKPTINTDQILTTVKKAAYDLREIDHQAMSKEEKESFTRELKEVKDIALSILAKIR